MILHGVGRAVDEGLVGGGGRTVDEGLVGTDTTMINVCIGSKNYVLSFEVFLYNGVLSEFRTIYRAICSNLHFQPNCFQAIQLPDNCLFHKQEFQHNPSQCHNLLHWHCMDWRSCNNSNRLKGFHRSLEPQWKLQEWLMMLDRDRHFMT